MIKFSINRRKFNFFSAFFADFPGRMAHKQRIGWGTGSTGSTESTVFLRLGVQRNNLAKNLFFARFPPVSPVFPVFPVLPVLPVFPVLPEPGCKGISFRKSSWKDLPLSSGGECLQILPSKPMPADRGAGRADRKSATVRSLRSTGI